MSDLNGTLLLPDGRVIEWRLGALNIVYWGGGTQTLRLPGDPGVGEIEAALIGWHQGEIEGLHTGRAMLQNEFRNLMDCQK